MRSMTERRRARIEKVLGPAPERSDAGAGQYSRSAQCVGHLPQLRRLWRGSVHLYYTHAPFPSLSRKTSASARKWVETLRHDSREELMKALRAGGFQVLATSCTPEAKPVAEYDFTRPTAIIMGNEHAGVSEELLPLVDGEAYIPMYGMIQSFNVSVAAALMLAEASRQRKLAGMYERMTWTPEEYEARLADWLERMNVMHVRERRAALICRRKSKPCPTWVKGSPAHGGAIAFS